MSTYMSGASSDEELARSEISLGILDFASGRDDRK